jgi:signal transduction histidine kinase
VRHVVTNHGGRVTVQSREGEGSTFVLHLPGQVSRPKGEPVGPTASPEGVLA